MMGPVRSVSQAFAILRVLAAQGSALTLTDIVRTTGLSPSSCHNLLRTLVGEGVIEAESGKRYRLTPGWEGCSGLTGGKNAMFIARAQPLMDRFARDHDSTIGLWRTVRDDRLELIALGESESPTRIHMMIGQRQPVGAGSTGRALAASQALEPAELRHRFDALRWRRALSFADYAAQVEQARANGFAIDDSYAFAGVCSLACTVGAAASPYCLSASTFSGLLDETGLRKLGLALRALAQSISSGSDV